MFGFIDLPEILLDLVLESCTQLLFGLLHGRRLLFHNRLQNQFLWLHAIKFIENRLFLRSFGTFLRNFSCRLFLVRIVAPRIPYRGLYVGTDIAWVLNLLKVYNKYIFICFVGLLLLFIRVLSTRWLILALVLFTLLLGTLPRTQVLIFLAELLNFLVFFYITKLLLRGLRLRIARYERIVPLSYEILVKVNI